MKNPMLYVFAAGALILAFVAGAAFGALFLASQIEELNRSEGRIHTIVRRKSPTPIGGA